MPDPTSDSVTDYRRGRGLADDIGTPTAEYSWPTTSHLALYEGWDIGVFAIGAGGATATPKQETR